MKLRRDLGIILKSAWHLAMCLCRTFEYDGVNFPFVCRTEAGGTSHGRQGEEQARNKTLKAGRGAVGEIAIISWRSGP